MFVRFSNVRIEFFVVVASILPSILDKQKLKATLFFLRNGFNLCVCLIFHLDEFQIIWFGSFDDTDDNNDDDDGKLNQKKTVSINNIEDYFHFPFLLLLFLFNVPSVILLLFSHYGIIIIVVKRLKDFIFSLFFFDVCLNSKRKEKKNK